MATLAPLRVFLSTADHSGDAHAAALIEAIRRLEPGAEFAGVGGPRMAEVGCLLLAEAASRSAMFLDVAREARRIWRLFDEVERFWRGWQPGVFVPIDSPGINFPLARRARRLGIARLYYIPPQVWAWGRWRLGKLRRLFDRLLVVLPFEEDFYRSRGLEVEYVGHPLFDYLPRQGTGGELRRELGLGEDVPLVGLLPGSRRREVQRLMPWLRESARLIRQRLPEVAFAVAAASPEVVPLIEEALAGGDLHPPVLLGRTLQVMCEARLCLVASGTATLQLLHFATPMVILYRLNLLEWCVMRLFKRSRYVGLVNVLADKRGGGSAPEPLPVPVVPEMIGFRDRPRWAAEAALPLIVDTPQRRRTVDYLRRLRAEVDRPGAVQRAARAIVEAARR